MNALKAMATTLWTQLLEAMQTDGLIARCITQSGPATTKVVVDACAAVMVVQQPWIGMHIKPVPSCLVVAIRRDTRELRVLYVDSVSKEWTDDHAKIVNVDDYVAYTFVNTDGAPPA